jgi:hypothetical protein
MISRILRRTSTKSAIRPFFAYKNITASTFGDFSASYAAGKIAETHAWQGVQRFQGILG